jgi:transposase
MTRPTGQGIRKLARVTGRLHNTVRWYLREGEAAAVRKPAPKRVEKLDPFKAYIVRVANTGARIARLCRAY